MLRATEIAGFIGVGLAGAAYIPQIWHLVRVHCAAGISRFAFSLWLGATILVTTNAIATGAAVFIVLGSVQLTATALILVYSTKYRSTYCAGHAPVALVAETVQSLTEDQLGADEAGRLAAASFGARLMPHTEESQEPEFTSVAKSQDVIEEETALRGGRQQVAVAGAQELFSFPWPGPGNSEGPVDPEGWSDTEVRNAPFASTSAGPLTTAPWPGPGNSEG